MALVFIDGFDHYATAEVTKKGWYIIGSPTINNAAPRTGAGCARIPCDSNSNYLYRAVPPDDVYTIGFGAYVTSSLSEIAFFAIRDRDGVYHLTFCTTSSAGLRVRQGTYTGTVLGETGSSVFPWAAHFFLEIKVFIDDSGGYVTIRVNGQEVLALTNKDTRVGGYAEVGQIRFGAQSTITGGFTLYIDDLYMCNNSGSPPYDSFLGDIYVNTLLPDADGDVNDWTASGGNRYAAVDDPTDIDDDTTYVYETVNESDQLFSFGALSSSFGEVVAVQEVITCRKDSSKAVNIRPLFRTSGDSEYEGGLIVLGDSYVSERKIWELNPADSAQWEPTDIDNGQFGMIFTYTTTTSA